MHPVFADPKTDVIFKKIFGQKERQHLLIDLLNALLELDTAHRIVDLEYLTPEQLPLRKDGKLSILDVKCLDAMGTRYVIEMQVVEAVGFQKRVVYNASKAYTTQLSSGEDYPSLNDVIAVTICDFSLWSDTNEAGVPRVPMLSRWRMQEQHSGVCGLPEVQYVFLELPKYARTSRPRTTVEKWAHLFRVARSLDRVPEELSEAPYAQALEIARLSNLSADEATEYEREKMAVQDIRGSLTLAEQRGEARGRAEGLRQAILGLCEVLALPLDAAQQAELLRLTPDALQTLFDALKQKRAWPASS